MRNKKALKNKRLKWIKELLIYVVIIVFCATLFPKYVIRRTQVDGNSMETTLQDKDDLIVEKVTYHFKDPDRFDIITFYPKGRNAKEYYIKRVIGLPGETIQIHDGKVYINGSVLEDDVSEDDILTAGLAAGELTLGENEYFVLGDNRNNSEDSRFANVGVVKKDDIVGSVWFIASPMKRMRLL